MYNVDRHLCHDIERGTVCTIITVCTIRHNIVRHSTSVFVSVKFVW